jgi:Raf kinase inhibitor-like YbhB/YbcL family protein
MTLSKPVRRGTCAGAAFAALLALGVATTNPAGAAPSTATASRAHPASTGDPFRFLPHVPSFTLTSTTIRDGQPLPRAQWTPLSHVRGARNVSPQLRWSPVKGAKSYAVTMFDPQAPIEGGVDQWTVANIPASTHTLPAGAGGSHGHHLPAGAVEVPTDVGPGGYVGAAPPSHGPAHDYWFTVWALNTSRIHLPRKAPNAAFNFGLAEHTIARASIVCPTAHR